MKSELFLRIIGDIDDDLIMEAEGKRRFSPRWVRIAGGAAACLVIAAAAAVAVPLLIRSSDMAAEDTNFTYSAEMSKEYADIADDVAGDGKVSSQSGSISGVTPAETEEATKVETTLDTGAGYAVRERTFYFYDGKTWRTEVKSYPDGLPSMQTIVNDYLAAAGSKAQCTAARSEVVGEKDEVKNGIVTHTVGVRTWYLTLNGEISETLFRGLVNTVLGSAVPSSLYLVQAETPAGTMGPAQASRIE